ncbi:MAG: hypothetical protein U1E36_06335 [Rickettsiales bacterium]
MKARFIILTLMIFLPGCGNGDGWYESKDWGSWAKSEGGAWYGEQTAEEKEEESWWCSFTNTCSKEESVACSVYGRCDKDGDGDADKDDEKKTVACSFYGNCPE